MLNPYVSDYVFVKNLGGANYVVLARTDIPMDEIVEICPVSILTKKEAIILGKVVPSFQEKIFTDSAVLKKEYELLAELSELELEKRLDRGEITPDEFRRILMSKMNPTALLESKSHVVMLGNGMLYRTSEIPNLICEYHEDNKVCVFKTVRFVSRGNELTYFKQ